MTAVKLADFWPESPSKFHFSPSTAPLEFREGTKNVGCVTAYEKSDANGVLKCALNSVLQEDTSTGRPVDGRQERVQIDPESLRRLE